MITHELKLLFARLASIAILAFAIFAATRALIRVLPGDPLETLIAESGTSLSVEALDASLHLDKPYFTALGQDLRQALHGDLGVSLITRQPIGPLIARRFARTAELGALSLVLTLVLSLTLGLCAADSSSRLGRRADLACSLYGACAAAMPTPWIGPFLIVLFGVWLPIFPIGDHVLLPALSLAFSYSGLWSRLVRERVRETLFRGAAPGARARGVPEARVLFKYGLVPASGALLAYLGTQAGGLLAGAFVTEVIFDWRGLGSLLVEAVLKRDYPVVESATFVVALACLLGTAAGDWAQKRMDPRI